MKKVLLFLSLIFLSHCASTIQGYEYSSYGDKVVIGIGSQGANHYGAYSRAEKYCLDRNKYAFFYGYDWFSDADGYKANYWCYDKYVGEKYVKGKMQKVFWTNYGKITLKPKEIPKKTPINSSNKKINTLDQLIKDYENGKISKREFNKRKKKLLK